MKKNIVLCISLLAAAMLFSACLPPSGNAGSTTTPPVLADSFFAGQAWLDVNANGQIDAEDTPLANATFIVALQGGGEFGAQTDENGKAFVTIPARVKYPVTVRMEAPKDSTLSIVEPSTATLEEPTGETIQFLFRQ